ncbi:UNVERIFIED_CONTAM: hypothetical protein K2H54_017916 [Gekko kuhli]
MLLECACCPPVGSCTAEVGNPVGPLHHHSWNPCPAKIAQLDPLPPRSQNLPLHATSHVLATLGADLSQPCLTWINIFFKDMGVGWGVVCLLSDRKCERKCPLCL